MNDPVTVVRLMVGLTALVYLAVGFASHRGKWSPTLIVVFVAAIVIGTWAVAPLFLSAGEFGVRIQLRQIGLLVSVTAVVVQYLSLRQTERSKVLERASRVSPVIYAAGLVLATANWLVAVAGGLISLTSILRRVEESPRESDPPSLPPQDDE